MQQVVHETKTGRTRVVAVPEPIALPGNVVVAVHMSVISAGTERYVVNLASSNLLSKARQRPDHVRRVLQKLREDGLIETVTQLRAKLNEPLVLGYSAAGEVLACGKGVHDLKPGDRVAVAAPHASVVAVGRNLCARIPNAVTFEEAAYAPLGAIALQGVRLARVELGSRVLVIGLGLLGQITVGLLKSAGCQVSGLDLDPAKADLSIQFGAQTVFTPAERSALLGAAGAGGFDAVIITAAAPDNSTIELAAEAARVRGRVVAVGLVGLNLPREPFFRKEIELTVSHSLGVGRGDARYENAAEDYPLGQARWTVRRNIETVLDAIGGGLVPVSRLTSHRFSVANAQRAYELITAQKEPYLGVVLQYQDAAAEPINRVYLKSPKPAGEDRLRVSLIGVGNFARLVMLPKLSKVRGISLRGICSARGLSAVETGNKAGFQYAATEADEVLTDRETDAVIISTRHDLHAGMVLRALRAGKHVFVEKPLCITIEELKQIDEVVGESDGPKLMVGFNRRFAPGLIELKKQFHATHPITVHYRFAVPDIPPDVWVHDETVGGGRLIGEACHAIDACAAIIGSPAVRIYAETAGTGDTLVRADDRAFMTMRHANGSLSNVSYQAGGDRSMPAERIEVIGGGRTGVLEGWSSLTVWANGSKQNIAVVSDKGHFACLEAFLVSCKTGAPSPIRWAELRASSLVTILAERSAREGTPFEVNVE